MPKFGFCIYKKREQRTLDLLRGQLKCILVVRASLSEPQKYFFCHPAKYSKISTPMYSICRIYPRWAYPWDLIMISWNLMIFQKIFRSPRKNRDSSHAVYGYTVHSCMSYTFTSSLHLHTEGSNGLTFTCGFHGGSDVRPMAGWRNRVVVESNYRAKS